LPPPHGLIAAPVVAGSESPAGESMLVDSVSLGGFSDSGPTSHVIQYLLFGLPAASAVKNYVRRARVAPPRRLGALTSSGPKKAPMAGLLISVMPLDIIFMLTIGAHLAQYPWCRRCRAGASDSPRWPLHPGSGDVLNGWLPRPASR
jgi:hypothetical protein